MKIEALYLRERRMRIKHPFQTSLGTTLYPSVLFVEVHSDRLVGRGEITSGMGPFHSPEMPDTACHILCDFPVPLVPGMEIAAGDDLPALRAKKPGVPTFGITDRIDTPIARICDNVAITPVTSVSFTNSYVVPMALLGTILVVCAYTRTACTLALLRRSEDEDPADNRWHWAPSNGKDLRRGRVRPGIRDKEQRGNI